MEAGKGDTPRPFSDTRWDAIFRRDLVCETPPSECWSIKCQVRGKCKNEDDKND